ncbi:MAG: PAS domain-containing protein [Nitrospirae bacterium]|nr:PAS domain-containing protein [Nitrospirota bacterium]MBI4847259.1 PAS domain-containing protein [Nitrospirota bacterium]
MKKSITDWESILNSVSDPVSIHDKTYKLIWVNQAFTKLFSKKHNELIGKKCFEIIHDKNEPWPVCPHSMTLKTGKACTEEFFELNVGRYLQVSTSPISDEKAKIIGSVHILKDITDSKKADKALQKTHDEMEKRVKERTAELEAASELLKEEIIERQTIEKELLFRNAILQGQSETSIDGILVVNSEGKVISCNNRMRQMWNVPQELWNTGNDEALLNYAITQLKNPDEFLNKVKHLYAHREKKSRDEIELKDGKCFDRYSSPLVDSRGKYHGRVWYFRDITERKKTENSLLETEKKLKAHTTELSESNAALKVLLKQREQDRKDFEDNILSNLKKLVLPYLVKLKRNKPLSIDLTYLNIIESNLNDVVSPFSARLSHQHLEFSPREIMIAGLIKDGKRDKDIVEILNISLDTVKTHRKNIRKKLGICGKKINLKTKLVSIIK